MTSLEYDALQLAISNKARVLYTLYLRPRANMKEGTVDLNYADILNLLNAKEKVIELGRQINALLKELSSVGLIELQAEQDLKRSLNKETITLPLVKPISVAQINTDNMSLNHHAMEIEWRPETQVFEQICQLIGLIEHGYSTEELGEFIAYWLGYPERRFTDYQWTQKFVLSIKLRRQRFPVSKQQTKVGHQWVTLDATIEIDDNVRQLVEQYSNKEDSHKKDNEKK